MRRVISVFLPTWQTDLLRRQQGAAVPPTDKPLITATHDGRRQVVAAADRTARLLGLVPGMPVAQAQASLPGLMVVTATPEADARALEELTDWCLRYAPLTAPDRPDGIWIDVTGSAHLFGGEPALLADIVERLARSGVGSRAAIADTAGAAWAVARYAATAITVVPVGETAAALRPLPIGGLRLDGETLAGLGRLGFERIDQLLDAPRAPFTLRFGQQVIRRIDQALGRLSEPLEPIAPSDLVAARLTFPEPLLTPDALSGVIARLVSRVCAKLEWRGAGARRLDLTFERVDRTRQAICIGTARPSRRPDHLARLLDEHLEQVDPGLGIEAMCLAVPLTEPLTFEQPRAGLIAGADTGAGVSVLVDRLVNQARIATECTASAESRHDPQMTIPLVVEVKANGSSKPPARRTRRRSGAMQPKLGDDL